MPNLLRNILAAIVGIVVGGFINMALITLSPSIIPLPAGIDPNNPESLSAGIHLFEPRHFVMPFLAHAFGTFVGALAAYFIAATHRDRFAYAIGIVYLCGGIAACFMIPAPAWFMAFDLLLAYIPMAWLAVRVGNHAMRKKYDLDIKTA